MGKSLLSYTNIPIKFSHLPGSFNHLNRPNQLVLHKFCEKLQHGSQKALFFDTKCTRNLCSKAVLSEISYPKVGALSTGSIPASQLIQVVETAAKTGAEVSIDLKLIFLNLVMMKDCNFRAFY